MLLKGRFTTSSHMELDNSSEIVLDTAEQVPESAVEYGKGRTVKITDWSNPVFRNCVWFISFHAACLVDPLFLYIPLINEERKCVRLHQELKMILLILRSFIDLSVTFYFVSGFVHSFKNRKGLQTLDWWRTTAYSTTVKYIFAVLPVPQVVTLFFLTKRRGFTSSIAEVILNTCLLVHYFTRIVFTTSLWARLRKDITNKSSGRISLWLDNIIDNYTQISVIVYSSHVLGAFWYFLSYQREISCWLYACQSLNGCELSTLDCHDRHVFSNVTVLNDLCPVNPANAKVFDFGIFLDVLQSGMLGSTNFPQKCLHCFWWGLRNLSSLGQNLYTSKYFWEDLFAIAICMSGISIFLQYLNLLLQLSGEKIKSWRKSLEKERECSVRLHEIQSWEVENDLPLREWEEEIRISLKGCKLRADMEINLKTFLSILKHETSRSIKLHLCMPTLQKVPVIENLIEERLELLLDSLKPVVYDEGSHIFREREPIDKVVIITRGVVLAYTSSANERQGYSTTVKGLQKGDFCGEEILLHWKSIQSISCFDLPISNMVVKCSTRVEAFIIMANDLHSLVN